MLAAIPVNKEYCPLSSHQLLQPPLVRGTWDAENQILALDSEDAHEMNDSSEPRLLHLPIHRKALKSSLT